MYKSDFFYSRNYWKERKGVKLADMTQQINCSGIYIKIKAQQLRNEVEVKGWENIINK